MKIPTIVIFEQDREKTKQLAQNHRLKCTIFSFYDFFF